MSTLRVREKGGAYGFVYNWPKQKNCVDEYVDLILCQPDLIICFGDILFRFAA